MKIAIIDLEMNQPSGTIIQIGGVVVDTFKMEILDETFNQVCNPGEYPSNYISDLTGISRNEVRQAEPLRNVLDQFKKYLKKTNVGFKVGGWGHDARTLLDAFDFYGMPLKNPRPFDIKQYVNLFTHSKDSETRLNMGLKASCEHYEVPFDGDHHNAYWDAYNTAKLFLKVLEDQIA